MCHLFHAIICIWQICHTYLKLIIAIAQTLYCFTIISAYILLNWMYLDNRKHFLHSVWRAEDFALNFLDTSYSYNEMYSRLIVHSCYSDMRSPHWSTQNVTQLGPITGQNSKTAQQHGASLWVSSGLSKCQYFWVTQITSGRWCLL